MGEIGRYRLVSRLGSGGMAEVHTAVLEAAHGFQKTVVIKRILPELAAQEEYREMFIQEARLMASLSHANLVSVLDFGQADGGYFLALEFLDGIDLGRAIAHGPLPSPVALYLAIQVLRGLGYAHGLRDARGEPLGIVHRDVSPQNILLGKNGDVKLGDFGIARAHGRRRTAPGTLKGKASYMSPEQARGEAVDARSDLFSLGLVLYEALTGKNPYAGKLGALLMIAVRQGAIPPLPGDPRLSAALARALHPEPAERFQSAAEFIKALQLCEEKPAAGAMEVEELVAAVLAGPASAPAASPAPAAEPPRSPFTRMLSESRGPGDDPA